MINKVFELFAAFFLVLAFAAFFYWLSNPMRVCLSCLCLAFFCIYNSQQKRSSDVQAPDTLRSPGGVRRG